MDLCSLRYFLCIAQHLSFSRAAEELYVPQPTLSYHVAGLEKELGTKLFIREKRKIYLTEAGRILQEEATRACWHVDAAAQRVARLMSPEDTIRFGFLDAIMIPCVNRFIAPYLLHKPSLHSVMERTCVPLLGSLLTNKAYDFVFMRECVIDILDNSSHLAHRTAMRDSFSVAVPADHPCAGMDSISDLSALGSDTFLTIDKAVAGDVYTSLQSLLTQFHGLSADVQPHVTRNLDDLLGQVAVGRGFAVLPFYTSIPLNYVGVKLIRFTGGHLPSADIVVVWDKTRMTPAKKQYLEYFDRSFPEPLA